MQAGHSVLVTGFTARLPARLDPPPDPRYRRRTGTESAPGPAAHRAARATADMIIEAARSVPGARRGSVPVTRIPAAVTASGYCQM